MKDLAGRTAMISGASRGIGPYIARTLADQKMNLVLAARSEPGLEEVAADMRSRDVRSIVVPTDVANSAMLEMLVTTANREFGTVDVLVNNAGVEKHCAYDKLDTGEIERVVSVNLTGAMLLTRMVLPGMLKQRRGHIVNMSSLAGKAGPPCFEPYAATKAGLIAFTESLRAEYRGTGISASVICPGFVTAGIYSQMKEEASSEGPRILGPSSAEEVARAVLRAIYRDTPEIIVNPGPTRLLTALAELSPSLAEWVMRCSGVVEWFRKCAEARERNPNRNNKGT
jgi:short-subunit dehydrogenase